MAIPRPSKQELIDRYYNRLVTETNLTADLDSGITGMLCKLHAEVIDEIWAFVEDAYNQSNLTTATGSSLDQMGVLLGVPRKAQTKATTLGQTRSIRFTNLGNVSVSIPISTRVWKSSDQNLAFFTTEGGVVSAGGTLDLHATAQAPGQAFNVGIGEIDSHNVASALVRVTNILAIQNGNLVESDSSYRERLLQEFRRRNAFTPDNAVALLRSVDGVRDVLFLNMNRGTGTFDAIIVPYNQSQANDVLAQAQSLLDEAKTAGVSGLVKLPIARTLDVKISLTFKPTANNQEAVRQAIKAQLTSRMDALPIEDGSGAGSVFPSQLRAIAAGADNNVLDASITAKLDDIPLSPEGEIRVGIGERVTLRVLSVQ
jgi:uncharacterized phage protein gp47/JayE